MQALSSNANWYGVDREVAQKMIQPQNEKLAELVARYLDRLVSFASVALQFPEMAAEQLEEPSRSTVCAAHGGGYLPSNGARSDYCCNRFPEGSKIKKHPQNTNGRSASVRW